MAIVRQTSVHPIPTEAARVDQLLDELEKHYATFPGYILGFRYKDLGDPGTVGRIALWRSHADADHAATHTHTIALRSQLNTLIAGEHVERVLEIVGTPQKLPRG